MGEDAAPSGPGDVAVSATHVPLPEGETPAAKAAAARSTRAEKLAAAKANRSSAVAADETTTDAAVEPVSSLGAPAASAASSDKKPDAPVDDEAHKRGIESIEKRDKRQREQIAAERQKLEKERADFEKARAEAAKPTSIDDLKKLPIRDRYVAALKLAEVDPDNDEIMDVVARDAYARSKSGKADPKNKAYADQVAEKRHSSDEVAELKRELAELTSGLTEKEQKAQAEQFANRYLDEAVKAIPATPSLVGRAHSKNPARARAEMLHVGQELEREIGETPTHAEVIAEYEKRLRQDLADRGLDDATIAGMLAPPKAAAATAAPPVATKPTRTLDPSAGPSTQTIHGPPTRAQKLERAKAELRKQRAEG